MSDNTLPATRTKGSVTDHIDRKLITKICSEHERSLEIMDSVKTQHGEFIRCRWRMGRLIAQAIGDRGRYGDKVVEQLAEKTGLHANTIYECRKFASSLDSQKVVTEWIARTTEREGVVLWKNVRDLIWERDDVATLGVEGAVERRLNNVEKRMQRLGQEMHDTLELAQSHGVGPDLRDQAVGVATKMLEMAHNPRETYDVTAPPRDDFHTQFIREMACYWCGEPARDEVPTHPHHYEVFGIADRGSDFAQIPSCHDCHRNLHDTGVDSWESHVGVSFERAIADVLHFRFTGRFIEWREGT